MRDRTKKGERMQARLISEGIIAGALSQNHIKKLIFWITASLPNSMFLDGRPTQWAKGESQGSPHPAPIFNPGPFERRGVPTLKDWREGSHAFLPFRTQASILIRIRPAHNMDQGSNNGPMGGGSNLRSEYMARRGFSVERTTKYLGKALL